MTSSQARAKLDALRQQDAARTRKRRRAIIGAGAVVLVVAVLLVVWAVVRTPAQPQASTGLVTYSNLSRDHVTGPVTYQQTPPAGGPHSAVWQNCGIYNNPVPNENAVHSLEHGAVWITYRPDLPAAQVATLKADVKGQPYGLLSPFPGLPSPVVATAWGVQLRLDDATDPRLQQFLATYGDGSKAPEPKGECTGGTGTPDSN
ncbi:Protein of unknown function [Raineyella antarctica]|uniref:DUF3105 domain-containing protein n=1 Tax=Raineyella antarctica TaxID=1577474 RepID=A0A1G6GEP6_9ACTN|nr:DUF3105 domain-containing protein [Raineyella antarctica]SDB80457.1 Protein of unknown function [Raineyella antarctica]